MIPSDFQVGGQVPGVTSQYGWTLVSMARTSSTGPLCRSKEEGPRMFRLRPSLYFIGFQMEGPRAQSPSKFSTIQHLFYCVIGRANPNDFEQAGA